MTRGPETYESFLICTANLQTYTCPVVRTARIITRTSNPVIGPSCHKVVLLSLIPRHTAPGLVGLSSLKLSP